MASKLIIDIIAKNDQVLKSMQEIERQAFKLGRLGAQGFNVAPQIDALKEASKESKILGKVIEDSFKGGKNSMKAFNFEFLNFLFAGMALQRIFGGVFRSMTNFFDKLGDTSLESSKNISNLTASFEFFKFQIFDTIASSEPFGKFVENMTEGLAGMGKFFREHPALADLGVEIGSIGISAGAGLTAVALIAQIGKLNLFGPGVTFGEEITKGVATIGIAVGISMLIKDIFDAKSALEEGDYTKFREEIFDILGDAAIIAGFSMLGKGNVKGAAIVIGLGLILKFDDLFFEMGQNLLSGATKAFKQFIFDVRRGLASNGIGTAPPNYQSPSFEPSVRSSIAGYDTQGRPVFDLGDESTTSV